MKRASLATGLLASLLLIALPMAACGGGDDDDNPGKSGASGSGTGGSGTGGSGTGGSGTGGSGTGGSGGPGTGGSGGSGGSGGGTAAGLTCASYTFCTSYRVAEYRGQTIAPPAGGAIADGLYRYAYRLNPKGEGIDESADSLLGIVFRGSSYRSVGFSFGDVGTYATSGGDAPTLTLTATAYCDDQKGEASDSNPSGEAQKYPYTVAADGSLHLYSDVVSSEFGEYQEIMVFVKASSLCADPLGGPPATPGDSVTCNVTNCGCAEANEGPADADTCRFVSGG